LRHTPFRPLLRNPHLLTIFSSFARRRLDTVRFPVVDRTYSSEDGVQVLVKEQRPPDGAIGELVLVHGLEGSCEAGYMRSMAQLALEHGYAVHRTNMRSCGGTDTACRTMYHAGLTEDTLAILRAVHARAEGPVFLCGYSLGGNVSLKLAGELSDAGRGLLRGVVAVSTPLELATCVRTLSRPANRIYQWKFLRALKARIRRRAALYPDQYSTAKLASVRSVYEFDDAYVAPFFGFGNADNYYDTQSAIRFVEHIRVPTLLVQAEDDPMIPFEIFHDRRIRSNPWIVVANERYGGHLGFLANRAPRFWVDRTVLGWIESARSNHSVESLVPGENECPTALRSTKRLR
jgi:predicted alpha/beta-fold hydrolase